MANKAVFLDRDHTIIDDPGYLSDPDAVRLLPGVTPAIKSLAQAGYKIVVVTNQSGIARGLLTEEALERVHAEMCRQLSADGAHLDAIYYCPYHVEGTVEQYAIESDLRKPKPGMMLRAAEELGLDLSASWMVGDGPGDVEAGQRAGCRTVRLRTGATHMVGEEQNEDVQADFTVRNLPDAAQLILRQPGPVRAPSPAPPSSPPSSSSPAPAPAPATADRDEVCREILRHVRNLARADLEDRFSIAKALGGFVQALALLALVGTIAAAAGGKAMVEVLAWGLVAVVLQVLALTCFTIHRSR